MQRPLWAQCRTLQRPASRAQHLGGVPRRRGRSKERSPLPWTGAPCSPKRTWAEKTGRSPSQRFCDVAKRLRPREKVLAHGAKALEESVCGPWSLISCTRRHQRMRVRLSSKKPHEVRQREETRQEIRVYARANMGHPSRTNDRGWEIKSARVRQPDLDKSGIILSLTSAIRRAIQAVASNYVHIAWCSRHRIQL